MKPFVSLLCVIAVVCARDAAAQSTLDQSASKVTQAGGKLAKCQFGAIAKNSSAPAQLDDAQAKCDAVLEGVLRVTADGQTFDLKSGDRLYVPAGTRHAAEVVGEKTVVSLDGTMW